MRQSELRKLPFNSSDLPVGWRLFPDFESTEPIFLALPGWLVEKMRSGSYISPQDFSRYVSEVNDLEINYHLN